jgi:hypothetical protein
MIRRFDITLANSRGVTREAFASRKDIVVVELLARCPERLAVLATPQPSFDDDSDYLVTVVCQNGQSRIETLAGKTPDWALAFSASAPGTVDPVAAGAIKIASQTTGF